MRDIALLVFTAAGLGTTLRYPFVGLLLWVLFALMNPHQETYSFAHTVPWNLVIAVITIASWLVSSERKSPPQGAATALVLTLLAWTTLNTFFAFDPSWSWIYWNRAWKTVAMALLAGAMTNNKVRFHALILVVALSLGYYGVKGGIFTLATGGHTHVYGPRDTMIYDNNELALALVMLLPLLNYLRTQSKSRYIRWCIVATIVFVTLGILGSYSREAYIALSSLMVAFWLRTKNKFAYPVVAAVVLIPLLKFMPASFYERAASIQNFKTDDSFQTRLDSWWVAYRYAMDHIPFGAGYYGIDLQGVWDKYIPGELHACHSIYFQTLGEQGVVGLALYLAIIAVAFLNFRAVRRLTKRKSELTWAYELAGMLQLSLMSFCIGGAAAPMNFFDLYFLWVILSGALLVYTRSKEVRRPAAVPLGRRLQSDPLLRVPPR